MLYVSLEVEKNQSKIRAGVLFLCLQDTYNSHKKKGNKIIDLCHRRFRETGGGRGGGVSRVNKSWFIIYCRNSWKTTDLLALQHRRRIETEEKAKVVVVVWVMYLNAELTIMQQGCLNKSFWENVHFGRLVVWHVVNWMIISFVKASISPSSLYSIHPFLHIILFS